MHRPLSPAGVDSAPPVSRHRDLAWASLACLVATIPLLDQINAYTLTPPIAMAVLGAWRLWRAPRAQAPATDTDAATLASAQGTEPLNHLLLGVLPVWHQHVVSARTQIDDAVNDLVGNFASITDQFEAAGFKGTVSASSQNDATASLLALCEEELQQVITVMNALTHSKDAMNTSMQELMLATKDLQTMAAGVAQIASQTNLLAINAAIEAAHAGDSGRGFATIAKEIRGLSQSSAQTASQITQRIARVTEIMNGTSAAAAKASTEEETAIGRSSSAVNDVLAHMRQLSADADTMRDRGNVIRNDIEQLIIGLQFQDRVNQLMSVVDGDITRLRDQVERHDPPPPAEQWLQELQTRYTMREQRHRTDVTNAAASADAPARKVVFF
ncbi:MAG TPA: methyl-accepting chemotaxis protein [Aquabacterium sp.]|uniref:methyl-accepting chemotaxis protein n=1 Tax=Aquabacterium sp. TaxID=1872578 RepID=UPI002E354D9F|nr:methyl-accepting chemotaxis protein [Aquabacterium sp.]HEX5374172.1 methyl-accepting chemotaxis protein [Aquabacterium sp.]